MKAVRFENDTSEASPVWVMVDHVISVHDAGEYTFIFFAGETDNFVRLSDTTADEVVLRLQDA